MDIVYKKGDLLKATESWIAHGCNAQGVAGSGVALAIRQELPWAYEAYRDAFVNSISRPKLGDTLLVAEPRNDESWRVVVHCITQEFYGREGKRYVSYDAVDVAMHRLHQKAFDMEVPAVAMPKIGAGLGGGDWRVISAIIEGAFISVQPVVYEL